MESESGGVVRGRDVYDDEPRFRNALIGFTLWSTSMSEARFGRGWDVHPVEDMVRSAGLRA